MLPATLEVDPRRHRRYSCNELLAGGSEGSDTEPADPEGILGQDSPALDGTRLNTPTSSSARRAFFIRTLALLCACSLSVGSH